MRFPRQSADKIIIMKIRTPMVKRSVHSRNARSRIGAATDGWARGTLNAQGTPWPDPRLTSVSILGDTCREHGGEY